MLFDFNDNDDFFRSPMLFANRPMTQSSLFSVALQRPRTPPSSFFDADDNIRASRERVQQEIDQLKQLYEDRRKQWQEQQEQQQERLQQAPRTVSKPSSYSVSSSEFHSSDVNGKHTESSKSMHKAVKPSPNVGYQHYECNNRDCFGFRVYTKPNVVRAWYGGDNEGEDIPIGVDVHKNPKAYHAKLHAILESLSHANNTRIANWAEQAKTTVEAKTTPQSRKRSRSSSSHTQPSKRSKTRKNGGAQSATRRRRRR